MHEAVFRGFGRLLTMSVVGEAPVALLKLVRNIWVLYGYKFFREIILGYFEIRKKRDIFVPY